MSNILKYAGLILISVISSAVIAAPNTGEYLVKEKWVKVEIQATVQQINMKTREVTLMGPNGNLITITAGDEVKRLNEVKVGDIVATKYFTYLEAEFRKPTAEEEKQPLIVVTEASKAPPGMPLGAQVGAIVQAVVSIEIINRPYMEVTIKGPRGNYVTIPVEDKKMITEIRVGQRLVMTYAEAVAVSLIKIK